MGLQQARAVSSPLYRSKTFYSRIRAGDPFSLPFVLDMRPGNEFGHEAGKAKLANLRLGDRNGAQISFVLPGHVDAGFSHFDDADDGDTSRQQTQLMRLAGWVSTESRVTVS